MYTFDERPSNQWPNEWDPEKAEERRRHDEALIEYQKDKLKQSKSNDGDFFGDYGIGSSQHKSDDYWVTPSQQAEAENERWKRLLESHQRTLDWEAERKQKAIEKQKEIDNRKHNLAIFHARLRYKKLSFFGKLVNLPKKMQLDKMTTEQIDNLFQEGMQNGRSR